ncbi:TPA: hypothetical protein NY504_004899 [Escherichia coli]|nr:hypothetical protein [Escherichia coli]HCK2604407.1 hypothetical protein [Escherichia coli]
MAMSAPDSGLALSVSPVCSSDPVLFCQTDWREYNLAHSCGHLTVSDMVNTFDLVSRQYF